MKRQFSSEIIQCGQLVESVVTPFWKDFLASVARRTPKKTYKNCGGNTAAPNQGFSADDLDFIVKSHQAPLQVLFLDLTQKTFFKA